MDQHQLTKSLFLSHSSGTVGYGIQTPAHFLLQCCCLSASPPFPFWLVKGCLRRSHSNYGISMKQEILGEYKQ